MNAIVEFLANNIFVVIIVIGFVLSLLRKSGGSLPRMPDFGGGGNGGPADRGPQTGAGGQRQAPGGRRTTPPTAQRLPGQETARAAAQTVYRAAPPVMPPDTEGESGGEGVSGKWPERPERPERLPLTPLRQAAAPMREGAGSVVLPAPGADDLRRAVLWAEILGPPRAKRPMRRH